MFRCKVCGWIHDGATPPDVCISCGATADRFRPMDDAEIDAVAGALSSYGVVTQGFDDIEVDYTRRIRLLSYVDASFYTNFVARSGPRLPIYTGDPQWFQDNIPCMTACPSHTDISRYIALIADGRYADSFELNREHNVFPGCLGRMKPTAILVNASRGPVVDTDALIDALRNGSILGAALDVTDPEPLPADHPLVNMTNCIVVPHTASATVQTRDLMAELAATNLLAGLKGERPPAAVNADEVM